MITTAGLYVCGKNTANLEDAQPIQVDELIAREDADYKLQVKAELKDDLAYGEEVDPLKINVTPIRSFYDSYSDYASNIGFVDDFTDVVKQYANVLQHTTNERVLYYYRDGTEHLEYLCKTIVYVNNPLYLYLTRSEAERGKYISGVYVSYSGDGIETLDENDKKKTVTKTHNMPIDSCLFDLVSNGPGTLITVNLSSDQTDEVGNTFDEDFVSWHNNWGLYHDARVSEDDRWDLYCRVEDGKILVQKYDYDDEFAYIYVTYTNNKNEALSDIYIYESTEKELKSSNVKVANGATAKVMGKGFRVKGSGNYFYLCGVKASGDEITDISISTNAVKSYYKTVLSTDLTESNYQKYFIQAKHVSAYESKSYLSSIVIGQGSTQEEAKLNLLKNGCQSCNRMYIKNSDGSYVYFGSTFTDNKDKALTGLLIENAETNNRLDQVMVGNVTYNKIGDNLNGINALSNITPLYSTKSKVKAAENGGEHYITDFILWPDEKLYDCFKSQDRERMINDIFDYLASIESDMSEILYPLIFQDDGSITRWDIVRNSNNEIMTCSSKYPLEIEDTFYKDATDFYIFVHYSDNYISSDKSLLASIFGNPTVIIPVISGVALITAGVIYFVIKKKKVKEPITADITHDGK